MLKQLYMHMDGDSCVYVGVGSPGRAYDVYNRQSNHSKWCEDQLMCQQSYVRIVLTDQDSDMLLRMERDLITSLAPKYNRVYNPNYTYTKPSDETKRKISETTKASMCGMHEGKENPTAKLATIYDAETGRIIAENVIINLFCKEFGYNQGHLSRTARGEAKQHRGLYAKYKDNSN